jgi:hypothetical protein
MKKTLIALMLLVPALALAQEKYTNDDLDIPPKRDAYTNADLERLPPLPAQAEPVMAAEAMPAVKRDLATEDLEARKADMAYDRTMIEAEIRYWEKVIKIAHSARAGGPNGYPNVGGDTAEARTRIIRLQRLLYMLEEEQGWLR